MSVAKPQLLHKGVNEATPKQVDGFTHQTEGRLPLGASNSTPSGSNSTAFGVTVAK